MWDWALPAYRVMGFMDRSDPAGRVLVAQGGRGGTEADEPPQPRHHRGDQGDREHHHRVRHVEPQPRVGRGGVPGSGPGRRPAPRAPAAGERTVAIRHRSRSANHRAGARTPATHRRPARQQQAGRCHAQATEHQQQASRGGHRRGEQVQRLHERATPHADQEPGARPPPAPDRGGERLGHGPSLKPQAWGGPDAQTGRSGVTAGERPGPGRERGHRVPAQQAEGQPGRQQVPDRLDRDQRIPHRCRAGTSAPCSGASC